MPMYKENLESDPLEFDFLENVRRKILRALEESGFSIIDGKSLFVPEQKDFIRDVHQSSVKFLRDKKKEFIEKVDCDFVDKYIIDGSELDVPNIQPKLVPIFDKTQNSLFNWIKLHWSIPISAGYGRRLRYLVMDHSNSAVIGIIGLSDPVYGLKDRDRYIGWSHYTRKSMLKHMMDAFVLGAVPPYSKLLGGKLVASLLMSSRILEDFRKKYKGRKTLISGEEFDGRLAAITTASALGKSSIYDRINVPGSSRFIHVGWSSGSGEFQFFNGVYDDIFKIAHHNAEHLKNRKWGNGVRNRRTVILTGLEILGLPDKLLYHNIKRELFLIPLGRKSLEYLRGSARQIQPYNATVQEISNYAVKRWLVPRSIRKLDYLEFSKQNYSLLNACINSKSK